MTALRSAFLALILLITIAPVKAQFTAEQKAEICKLLPLPTVSVEVDFSFSTRYGFVLKTSESEDSKAFQARQFLTTMEPSEPLQKVAYLVDAGQSASDLEETGRSKEYYRRAIEIGVPESNKGGKQRRIAFLEHILNASLAIDDWPTAEHVITQFRQLIPDSYKTTFADDRCQLKRITDKVFPQGTAKLSDSESAQLSTDFVAECKRLKANLTATVARMERQIPDPRKREQDVYLSVAIIEFMLKENPSIGVAIKTSSGQVYEFGTGGYLVRVLDAIQKANLCVPPEPIGLAIIELFRTIVNPDDAEMVLVRYRDKIRELRKVRPLTREEEASRLNAETVFCLVATDFDEFDALKREADKLSFKDDLLFQARVMALSKNGKNRDAEYLLRDRLRTSDTARLRHFLCRVLEKRNKWASLQIEAQIAGEKYPEDPLFPLFGVGAKLKRLDGQLDSVALAERQSALERHSSVGNGKDKDLARRYYQTVAAIAVCAGQTEKVKEALAQLQRINEEDEEELDEDDETFSDKLLAYLK